MSREFARPASENRNGFGEVIQRSSPDSGTTVYEYNALGKVTKITDGRGIVTDLTYDNAGRILTKVFPATPAENITYTWDSIAGSKGKGHLDIVDPQTGFTRRIYDALGRVTRERINISGINYFVDYTYDGDGKLSSISYPSGGTVNYGRDPLGRVGLAAQAWQAGATGMVPPKEVTC